MPKKPSRVKLTPHARDRMKERGITYEQIRLTVMDPSSSATVERELHWRKLGTKTLMVVWELKKNNTALVISVRWL